MKERKRRQNNRWLWAAVAGLTAVWMILALLVLNHWRIEVRMAGPEEAVVEYAGEYADPGAQALLCGTLFWRQGLELPLEITGVWTLGGWVPRRLSTGRRYWACGDRRCAG